ncbi:peptidoglycan-binding protein [Streptomyces decoyicus]|uniref:peptidoglycan-binding protein n=1 Tax=Streptomyces decoyicus TaxID=249567 RepID=UPI002E179C44
MPDLWMPDAQRCDVGDHAPTDGQYPAKAIAHITWDRNATAARPADLLAFASLRSYFSGGGSGAAPHILWDPFTGQFAQFFPATSRSKSVMDLAGGTRTNRAGRVVIQVEALFFPYCRVGGKTYAKLADTPCKGWDRLNAWVHSWGVPNAWPMGRPVDFTPHRSESVWETKGGWYGHSQTPENDHQDPGSWPAFVGGTAPTPAPSYQPYPGAAFFMKGFKPALGKTSPVFTAMGKRLVAVGCGRYKVGPGPTLGTADVDSYEAYQRSLGYTGAAAKWPPGPTSWNKLHVPRVS